MQWLLLRYLQAFGPASVQDFAQFTMLSRPVVRHVLHEAVLAGQVAELEGPDEATLSTCPGRRSRPSTPCSRAD